MQHIGPQGMKRFFEKVGVGQEGRFFTVELDGRPMRSPARTILRMPTRKLAQIIADEWDAQGEMIHPANMPLTRLANVANDHMSSARMLTVGELVRYAANDLLCFRVQEPLALRERQQDLWDPWLDWAAKKFGARLATTTTMGSLDHPVDALENLRNEALNSESFMLTGLAHVTAMLGSAVLGFAMMDGKLSAQQAFDLSRVEEDWQIEHWGEDEEARARAEHLLTTLQASETFMAALRPDPA